MLMMTLLGSQLLRRKMRCSALEKYTYVLGTSSRKELMKFCLIVSLCMCACVRVITNFILILPRVTLHPRTANQVGEDSRCRGGIVNIRVGFSRALFVRRESSTALWRFRASTSNSPSSRTWPHYDTNLRYIYQTYAQQDIRVCEDDHLKPQKKQYQNPKAL